MFRLLSCPMGVNGNHGFSVARPSVFPNTEGRATHNVINAHPPSLHERQVQPNPHGVG